MDIEQITEKKIITSIKSKKNFFYIETLGCQMNVADSELIIAMLNEEGFIESDNPWNSDVIFINTCSIRERAEEKVHSQLGRWDLIKKSFFLDFIDVIIFFPVICSLSIF